MVGRDRGWMLTSPGGLARSVRLPHGIAVYSGASSEWAAFSDVAVVCLETELQRGWQATNLW